MAGSASLLVVDPTALRAPLEEPGGADPEPLPQGRLQRRLRRGTGGAARAGCRRPLGLDGGTAQGCLGGQARALAQAGSLGQGATSISGPTWKGLLVDLKRRGLEIAPELVIADGALGFWKAIEEVWPKTRGQRCWMHKTANVRGQAAQEPAIEGQAGAARHLDGRDQGRRRGRVRRLHRELRPQVRQGGYLPGQGPRGAARVPRLPRRALEAPAYHQPHREYLRHRAAPNLAIKGMSLEQDGAGHDLQARTGGRENLAPPRRLQSVAQAHPRSKVHRRYPSR